MPPPEGRAVRPTMEQVLLDVAAVVATRSTCSRGQHGAVIARDGRILSSGYNGAPAGMKHCLHPPDDGGGGSAGCATEARCTLSVHAEANAIAYAARRAVALAGATMYCTTSPCVCCAQFIISTGLVGVVYDQPYRDLTGVNLLWEAGLFADPLDKPAGGRRATAHQPATGLTPTATSTVMPGVQAFAQSETPRRPLADTPGSQSWLAAEARQLAARLDDAFPGRSPRDTHNQQVLALAEEVGEFIGAYRRWSGQARRQGSINEVELELADVAITAYVTADVLGVDLDAHVSDKLATIHSRPYRED